MINERLSKPMREMLIAALYTPGRKRVTLFSAGVVFITNKRVGSALLRRGLIERRRFLEMGCWSYIFFLTAKGYAIAAQLADMTFWDEWATELHDILEANNKADEPKKLVANLSITNGWISPEGHFYPCQENLTDQDWDDYSYTWLANGHEPCARTILREVYSITEDELEEKTGYGSIQEFLMEVNQWMRIDYASVLGGTTQAQVDVLRQMLTMPIINYEYNWEDMLQDARSIINRWERENEHT